jgi:hypothetical protein
MLAVYAVLATLVLAPVLSTAIPCLGDFLNHLARVHILRDMDANPALGKFYQSRWNIVPYYGMDIPVLAMARFVGIYAAGRFFVAVCLLMPVAAAAALHFAWHRRIGFMPAFAFLLSYNYDLGLGFVCYVFSVCLGLMLFAAWILAEDWPLWARGVTFPILSALVYMAHSFAFAAYGLMVAGWEIGRLFAAPRDVRTIARAWTAAGMQVVIPAILVLLLHTDATFGGARITRYGSLTDRIGAFLSPAYFPGGSPALLACILLFPMLAALLAGRPRLPGRAVPILIAMFLAACAAPHMLLNIWGVDLRLPLVGAVLFIGAATLPPIAGRTRFILLGALIALVAWRCVSASVLLHALDRQTAAMREVVDTLPQAARVLVVDAPEDAPDRLAPRAIIQHMCMVAVIDRDAFLPTIFAGTTPLALQPSVQNAASQGVNPLTFAQLQEGYLRPAPPGDVPAYKDGAQMYWLGWPKKFDYVLVMNFGGAIPPLPPVLQHVAGNRIAQLYKIGAS